VRIGAEHPDAEVDRQQVGHELVILLLGTQAPPGEQEVVGFFVAFDPHEFDSGLAGLLREFVLGGVTHTLLNTMTVPVLMSH